MKKIIVILSLFTALCVQAQVNIAWDAPAGGTNTGYVIYAHTNLLSGVNLGSATIKAVLPSKTQVSMTLNITNTTVVAVRWYVVATATYTPTGESPISNVLVIDLPPVAPVLSAPLNLRVVSP
jgi:hypothetical protein